MRKFLIVIAVMLSMVSYAQLPQKLDIDNQIIEHNGYVLSYNETCEQANWVFYKLTKEDLVGNKILRIGSFKVDTLVSTGSAHPNDYKYSGYDRGHLKPSGDEPLDKVQMKETYYMSNIAPQHPSLNRGMWKRLENYARVLTLESDSVYIVTGGILSDSLNTVNSTDICIPEHYFKVIYQFIGSKMVTYCYLMGNSKLEGDIEDYLVPISKVEELSKLKLLIKIG